MFYLGQAIKKLGFGLMRLPMIDDEIDLEQTKEMVDLFLNDGFTYFDTAYGYNNGKSEAVAKLALVDRYPRESFQLASKLPAWNGVKTADEAKAMFYTSLERTGAGYFDYYLLHNLGDERTAYFDQFGIWDFLADQKKKGLIKQLGFSFHDKARVLDDLLIKHPNMDFVQLQINYADWNSTTIESQKCYQVAMKHNKPVIIMEPVKGGSLAKLPQVIENQMKAVNPEASISSWAIRYAVSLDKVITVLSGMSNLEQMNDNLKTMKNFKPLDAKEKQVIKKVQEILETTPQIHCTDCKYCLTDCPESIPISKIFKAMNNYLIFDNLKGANRNYSFATRGKSQASACIACGNCEAVCPQHIEIIKELKRAVALFEK